MAWGSRMAVLRSWRLPGYNRGASPRPPRSMTLPPSTLTIGALVLDSPVIAAPVCGVSNSPHRRIVRQFGAGLVVTEMIKAYPLLRDDPKTRQLAHFEADEHPVACQI